MKPILALAALLLLVPGTGPTETQAAPDRGSVFGRVTDVSSGEGLSSVRVHLLEAKIGALTDEEGRFLLIHVPVGEATLRMERLGYHPVTVQVRVTSEMNERRIDIGLPPDFELGRGGAGFGARK